MKIEDGFLKATDWNTGREVWLAVDTIQRIEIDTGNNPPANRVYFRDGHIPYRDLIHPKKGK